MCSIYYPNLLSITIPCMDKNILYIVCTCSIYLEQEILHLIFIKLKVQYKEKKR